MHPPHSHFPPAVLVDPRYLAAAMFLSLREFLGKATKHWWALLTGLVSGAAGLVGNLSGKSVGLSPDLWYIFAAVGLVVAAFLAFHDIRRERDDLRKRLDSAHDRRRFQVQDRIEEAYEEYRRDVSEFVQYVDAAFSNYRRRAGCSVEHWKDALPNDSRNQPEPLEGFARSMSTNSCSSYLLADECARYHQLRQNLVGFFNRCGRILRRQPEVYRQFIHSEVRVHQYEILHLLSYLQPARGRSVHGNARIEEGNEPDWLLLWERWQLDPPG